MASNSSHSTKEDEGSQEILYFSGVPRGQEFIPECEVVYEGDIDSLDKLYKKCEKNPGHKNFINVNKLKVDDLPKELQTSKMLSQIFNSCVLTVKVRVTYTSLARPNFFADSNGEYPYAEKRGKSNAVRYGTGSIVEILYEQPVRGIPCPCPECRKSDRPKKEFWWVRARTATHVIFDKSEAECAQFECFCDSDDKELKRGIRKIYGIDIFNLVTRSHKKYPNDVCDVLCVTHDYDAAAILSNAIPSDTFLSPPEDESSKTYKPSSARVIISHPHGCSKRITVGKVLHLTVPRGHDYPTETPMPFKDGTFYRHTSVGSKGDGIEGDFKSKDYGDIGSKEDQEKNDHEVEPDLINQLSEMREKFATFRASLQAKPLVDETDSRGVGVSGEVAPIKEYVFEFYLMYTRMQILKILVTASVLEQRTKGGSTNFDQLVQKSYQELWRVFLGKEYNPSHDNLSGSDRNSQLQHWICLTVESMRDFAKLKLDKEEGCLESISASSVLVEWFGMLEMLAEDWRMRMKEKENEEDIFSIERILPVLSEQCLMGGFKIMSEREAKLTKEVGVGNDEPEKENTVDEEKERADERNDDNCDGSSGDDGQKEKELVPEGATFTLPENAEYAFRVYSGRPGWMHFPPGTKMTLPDGTEKEIGEPVCEFLNASLQPECSFVTYDIDTCRGSSGANVYCDALGPYLGTYFPHSGHIVQAGQNKSGLRDNFITLSSKQFLFGKDKDRKDVSTDAQRALSLLRSCKTYLLRLAGILKKD